MYIDNKSTNVIHNTKTIELTHNGMHTYRKYLRKIIT